MTQTPEKFIQNIGDLLSSRNTDLDALRGAIISEPQEHGPSVSGRPDQQHIRPEKGFVVKTTEVGGRKVFVNVCGSSSVPPPGNWPNGQMPAEVQQALNDSGEDNEYLRLPLSLGEPREDVDHSNEPCTTMDCIFNIDILKQAESFRKLKLLLIDLALGWAKERHGMLLDPKYKLPRMRYKGNVVPQVIRQDRKPVVKEITDVLETPSVPLRFPTENSPLAKADQALHLSNGAAKAEPPAVTDRQAENKVSEMDVSDQSKNGIAKSRSSKSAARSTFMFATEDKERERKAEPIAGQRDVSLGLLSHDVQYEGVPVHTTWITLCSPPGVSLSETSVELQGDQLVATSRLHKPWTYSLIFGVAASQAEGQLSGDSELRLQLPYAPLVKWLVNG